MQQQQPKKPFNRRKRGGGGNGNGKGKAHAHGVLEITDSIVMIDKGTSNEFPATSTLDEEYFNSKSIRNPGFIELTQCKASHSDIIPPHENDFDWFESTERILFPQKATKAEMLFMGYDSTNKVENIDYEGERWKNIKHIPRQQ